MTQQHDAPVFDSGLVGKRLEVLWKYFETTADGERKAHLIWATGRVARVADGLTDKRSSRAKKILPAGALLWEWDADPQFDEQAGEQWLILLPKKWNTQQQYAWRFDPRELGAVQANAQDPRRKHAKRASVDEDVDADMPMCVKASGVSMFVACIFVYGCYQRERSIARHFLHDTRPGWCVVCCVA